MIFDVIVLANLLNYVNLIKKIIKEKCNAEMCNSIWQFAQVNFWQPIVNVLYIGSLYSTLLFNQTSKLWQTIWNQYQLLGTYFYEDFCNSR